MNDRGPAAQMSAGRARYCVPGEGNMSDTLLEDAQAVEAEPKPKRKLPLSAKRLAANRANAQKSTGPRTKEGKSRSRMNALKHGMCSSSPLLPNECPATFETIKAELDQEFQP